MSDGFDRAFVVAAGFALAAAAVAAVSLGGTRLGRVAQPAETEGADEPGEEESVLAA